MSTRVLRETRQRDGCHTPALRYWVLAGQPLRTFLALTHCQTADGTIWPSSFSHEEQQYICSFDYSHPTASRSDAKWSQIVYRSHASCNSEPSCCKSQMKSLLEFDPLVVARLRGLHRQVAVPPCRCLIRLCQIDRYQGIIRGMRWMDASCREWMNWPDARSRG
ncbi:hypothetical protein BU24DRAFT_111331 [Aaosphaeria arxii CBS 175.79]|uniref:Uncharacterized protein n=1 Tax=Aaosphaeria arxii CBS 175.79 TaxID=1450172 RepID=A0A6A5Y1V4_9PLEO|nr:uncharacterized protein BU24DRAFT_111331 [Aaosphaeria arxii CBS 175.79]KAF2019047.1 hypothetical protein BU24DRAFT_111331 [Aaosphaeria arxii CBS 175.79]